MLYCLFSSKWHKGQEIAMKTTNGSLKETITDISLSHFSLTSFCNQWAPRGRLIITHHYFNYVYGKKKKERKKKILMSSSFVWGVTLISKSNSNECQCVMVITKKQTGITEKIFLFLKLNTTVQAARTKNLMWHHMHCDCWKNIENGK